MLRYRLFLSISIVILTALSSCSYHTSYTPSLSGTVNRYAAVLDYETCGFVVEQTDGWYEGALVLVIQMQGASINQSNSVHYGDITDYGSAGLYEFSRIAYIDGSTIWLQHELVNSYSTDGNLQLVLVPEYNNVSVDGTLTCPAWNGKVGGVLAISVAGKLILNADISANGKGFRGGEVHEQTELIPQYEGDYVSQDREKHSEKGENIHDFDRNSWTLGRGAPANGGGGGGNHNGGGGGGANGGCGGDGGYSYVHSRYRGNHQIAQGLGGRVIANNSNLFLGGGGGAGHSNNRTSSDGGNGGGIILIQAKTVVGNGHRIQSRGEDAQTSKYDGGSGGGAGGSIALIIENALDNVIIDVRGGDGGDSYNDVERRNVGTGGGGGGGTVQFAGNKDHAFSSTIYLDGGKRGTTILGSSYGATDGCLGKLFRNLEVPQGTKECDGVIELELQEKDTVDLTLSPTQSP